MSKLLIDNDCGQYQYCEQCNRETFHLRILKDNYLIEYICEECYMDEMRLRKKQGVSIS